MTRSGRVSFPPDPYLWIQALLALGAIVVAYLLTISLSLACFALPLWMFLGLVTSDISFVGWPGFLRTIGSSLLGCLTVGGLATSAISLWSLSPRGARFQPPGPRLLPADQPRLFSEVHGICEMFGIRLPDEVYLCADMTIGVVERGGLLGFGRRQILVVGLPALQVLTTGQFRAMVAAGLAHFYLGDTVLNPWINSLMSALARTLQPPKPARPAGGLSAFVMAYGLPIHLALRRSISVYWTVLVKICQSLTLRLERRADALACYIAGTQAFVSGLRSSYRYWPAAKLYWNIEVAPIVNAGFLPPLAEGFDLFVRTPRVDQSSAEFLDSQMNRTARTPTDPLPLLRDRIAVAPTHLVESIDADSPATGLLTNVEDTERRLIVHLFPGKPVDSLRGTAWNEVGRTVYSPAWRALVRENATVLAGLNPQSLPEVLANLSSFSARAPNPPGMLLSPLQRIAHLRTLLRSALSLRLMDHGWEFTTQAGETVFAKDGIHLNLSEDLAALESGKMSRETWEQRWRQLGLADIPLV